MRASDPGRIRGHSGRAPIANARLPLRYDTGRSEPGTADAAGEIDHLAFSIGDHDARAATGEHLTEAGIPHGGLVESNEGLSIHLTDPDGLAVELIAPSISAI